ncbi:MAG TPA: protein kinase, partial [Blastocatellia bacterium]|nr:protein kinase [Blastocatellia bacterium]
HYRIIKELGAGGMGEVYLAEDTRLGRQVALKFLPASYQYDPDRRTRFLAEARATSALRSPNIVSIFDIGEHEGTIYIVMEYVEGEPLSDRLSRGPLALRDVIDVAAQIADALAEAHKIGIIHCDIKSANLIVNERGSVKILDFGIARVIESNSQTGEHTKKLGQQTVVNVVVGTVSYMSPEQAMGHTLDHRSDIFSLGVVIYEMLTGRLPFEGETSTEVIDKIIHAEPPAIARLNYSVPPELERIARKCLEKEQDRRYQSAQEMLTDLRNLQRDIDSGPRTSRGLNLSRNTQMVRRARARRSINSLAILPLINTSGDPETDYLSDGITESLINNLSQLPKLRVMARSTVFRYKPRTTSRLELQEPDPLLVGRELNVSAILIGRIMQRDDTVIIKAELVDTTDGSHLWGGQVSRRMSEISRIEEEIATEISENLRLKLTGAQKKRLTRRYTENTEAYQLYLKGRYHWNKRTEQGIRKGTEYFEQAISLDANYALAYAGLADCYNLLSSYSPVPPRTSFLRAKATAMKALKLDPNLAEAHASLAHIRFWYEWDWPGAERDFKKAIELNPGYATAHLWYALYLAAMGRMDEAVAEVKRAQELDPLSLIINFNVARVLYFAGAFDEAEEQCLKALDMYPNFAVGHRRLGQIYEQKRMYAQAVAEFEKALKLVGDDTETMSVMGHTYAAWGKRTDAEVSLEALKELSKRIYVSPYSLARVHAGLGQNDDAFEWLEKVHQERHGILVYIKVEPVFESLSSDPRFHDLLRRMALE